MKVEVLKAAAATPEMIVAFMASLILVAALYMKKEAGHMFSYIFSSRYIAIYRSTDRDEL